MNVKKPILRSKFSWDTTHGTIKHLATGNRSEKRNNTQVKPGDVIKYDIAANNLHSKLDEGKSDT